MNRIDSANNTIRTDIGYDSGGNISTITTSARGNVVSYQTDDFGNVVKVTGLWNGGGGSTYMAYDAVGNLRFRSTPMMGGDSVEYRTKELS